MNIFLVDDHPMTIEGYYNALSSDSFSAHENIFTRAHNCEEAYGALLKAISSKKIFDIAIIDKGLPGFEAQSILSGSDVAVLLREKMPNCKIIMVTAHTEVIIVYDMVKKIRPEGFFIKNDITPEKLREAINDIMKGNQYQSTMVKSCISEIWKKELMVEDYNREILLYLSKGFKTKELEQFINLSTSSIQKRIIRMKNAFDVTDDSSLVREAIHLGFI